MTAWAGRLRRVEHAVDRLAPPTAARCARCGQTAAERIPWALGAFPNCPECGAAELTPARYRELRTRLAAGA